MDEESYLENLIDCLSEVLHSLGLEQCLGSVMLVPDWNVPGRHHLPRPL